MPLTAPFMDIAPAVPACALIVLALNSQVVWTFRRTFRWSHVKEIFTGAVPGIIFSGAALKYLSESHLKAGMGIFITCYALWGLFDSRTTARAIHPVWGYIAGGLSATLGMAFGFNGPPLAAYIAYRGYPSRVAKGALGAGLLVTGAFIVAAKAVTGQVNQMVIIAFLTATPAVVLGSKLGISLSSRLKEATYRKVIFLSLALMGTRITLAALQ